MSVLSYARTLARRMATSIRRSTAAPSPQTWPERPRLPQTDSSVCSAPGDGIQGRAPQPLRDFLRSTQCWRTLRTGNTSTNRGAANLEVHATSRLGALFIFLAVALSAHAQVPADSCSIETIRGPREIAPEVSAIAFGPDGKLYATFRRGYIYSLDTCSGNWHKFASGLHTPLGILPGEPGEFFVAQVPELTRVADSNGDGLADVYETIADGWGLSGNYHELIAGPVRDEDGNLYVTLSSASGGANPRFPIRGEFTRKGRKSENPKEGYVNRVGHYSPVPYRGCAVKISPEGNVSRMSCGFRQPNGLGRSPDGDIFATDNQGDWVGTSPLHHITQDAFHGHPGSLNWDETFGQDPVEVPIKVLAERRKMPAIQFPQNDMGGSVSQPLFDTTGGKFGPYSGQLFVAEWTYRRILRADLEKVGGVYQGACFIFIEGNGLRMANNRLAFSPRDGSLYTSQTSRVWGGSTEGLQKITWTGKVPMDILHMRLTKKGFELTFTKPVDRESAQQTSAYSMTHFYYLYHATYGSPKTDVTPAKVSAVTLSEDGLRATLELGENLEPGRVYELRPSGLRAVDGEPLATRLAAYTLNQLKE